MSKLYTGTVKELTGKVAINGRVLSSPELSTVCKLFAVNVGTAAKPARGKPATIWQLGDTGTFNVSDAPAGAVVEAVAEASAEEAVEA